MLYYPLLCAHLALMSSEHHAQRKASDEATLKALASLTSDSQLEDVAHLAHIWSIDQGSGEVHVTMSGRLPRNCKMTKADSSCSRPQNQPPASSMSDDVKRELNKLRHLKSQLKLCSTADPNLVAAEIQAAAKAEDTAKAKFCGSTTSKNTFGGGVDRFGPINGRHPISHAIVEISSVRALPPPPPTTSLRKSTASSSIRAPAVPHVCSRLYGDAQTRHTMQKHRMQQSQQVSAASSHSDSKPPKLKTGCTGSAVVDRLHKEASEREHRRRNAKSSEEYSGRDAGKVVRAKGSLKSGISFGRSSRGTPVAFFRAPGDLVDDMNPRRGPTPSWVAERANDDVSSNTVECKSTIKRKDKQLIPAPAKSSAKSSPQYINKQMDGEDKRKQFRRKWWSMNCPKKSGTLNSHKCEEPNEENPHVHFTKSLRVPYSGTFASDPASSGGTKQEKAIERLWADAEDRARRLELIRSTELPQNHATSQNWYTLVFKYVPAVLSKDEFVLSLRSFVKIIPFHPGTGGIVSVFDHMNLPFETNISQSEQELLISAALAESSAMDEIEYLALVYHDERKFEKAEIMLKRVLATREVSLRVIEDLQSEYSNGNLPHHSDHVKAIKKSTSKTMRNLAVTYRAIGGRVRYCDAGALTRRAKMMNEESTNSKEKDRGVRVKATEEVPSKPRAPYRHITVRCAGESTTKRLLSLHKSTLWSDIVSKAKDPEQRVYDECTPTTSELSSEVYVTLSARHLSVGMRVQIQAHDGRREGAIAVVKSADIQTDIRLPVYDQHAERVAGFARRVLTRQQIYCIVLDDGRRINDMSAESIVRAWLPLQDEMTEHIVKTLPSQGKEKDLETRKGAALEHMSMLRKKVTLLSTLSIHGFDARYSRDYIQTLISSAIKVTPGSYEGVVLSEGTILSTRMQKDPFVVTVLVLGREAVLRMLTNLQDFVLPPPGQKQAQHEDSTDECGIEDAEWIIKESRADGCNPGQAHRSASRPPTLKFQMHQQSFSVVTIRLEWDKERNQSVSGEEMEIALWWWLDSLMGDEYGGATCIVECQLTRKSHAPITDKASCCAEVEVSRAEAAQFLLRRVLQHSTDQSKLLIGQQFPNMRASLAVSRVTGEMTHTFSNAALASERQTPEPSE